jgi:hypothetical protein
MSAGNLVALKWLLTPTRILKYDSLHFQLSMASIQNCERDFLCYILLTNETTFTSSTIQIFQSLHESVLENPHATQCSSFQQRFSINIWSKIMNNYVPGSHMNLDHRVH